MTSLCPLSRYRPLSLITSHTMTSVSWNRESVSMGLALVSAKLLLWDWKDYLRAHFLSLNQRDDSCKWHCIPTGAVRLINVPSSQPETVLLFLSSQDSSLEQLYQCPTPACSPCCSPSSSHCHPLAMGRGHTSNTEQGRSVFPMGHLCERVVPQMSKPHLWARHQPATQVVILQGCNCSPVPIESDRGFST